MEDNAYTKYNDNLKKFIRKICAEEYSKLRENEVDKIKNDILEAIQYNRI